VDILAVIPSYNETNTISSVINETQEYVDEVLIVDDASTDETASIAREEGATIVEHVFNTGVGGSLRTGYRYAIRNDYDLIIQIDADAQHDPAYIPDLLSNPEDWDMVIGSRYKNESHQRFSLLRQLGIRFFTKTVNLLGGINVTDVTSGYRAIHAHKLERIIHRSDKHWAVEQTLEAAKLDYRIKEVSVEMPRRPEGTSQFTAGTFIMYPLRMADVIFRVIIFR
jgi:glycosyltransferase involved in cell wall biosynthesis